MRFAAAWSGDGFIDWKGIHFNGQHQVHPKLVGRRPRREPGRAGLGEPGDGQLRRPAVPRPRRAAATARCPKEWAQFQRHVPLRRPDHRLVHGRRRGDAGTRRARKLDREDSRDRRLHPHAGNRQVVAATCSPASPRPASPSRSSATAGCRWRRSDGFTLLRDSRRRDTPTRVKVLMAKGDADAARRVREGLARAASR